MPELRKCPHCNCELKIVTAAEGRTEKDRVWVFTRKRYAEGIGENDVRYILEAIRYSIQNPTLFSRHPGWGFKSKKHVIEVLLESGLLQSDLTKTRCGLLMQELISKDAFNGELREYRSDQERGYLYLLSNDTDLTTNEGAN